MGQFPYFKQSMNEISKIMNIIDKVSISNDKWQPSDIAFIKELMWADNNLRIVFYGQFRDAVAIWPDRSKDFFEIVITFKNVTNLRLDFNNLGLHQVSGFDILDISSDGLECINFRIEDYEDDTISFYCEDIEVNELNDQSVLF
ncbi:MAG: hypothetical protein LBI72_15140 [Flavobacteriaceae bacterium]|nr:hypothetical protein [Flavobacteriaceae bacterium]